LGNTVLDNRLTDGGKVVSLTRRRTWEDNIKMDFKEIGWRGMDCIHLALVNTIMNLRVP
jgi:hypothetical protein